MQRVYGNQLKKLFLLTDSQFDDSDYLVLNGRVLGYKKLAFKTKFKLAMEIWR